jgi:hypothetical protein
MEEFGYSLGLIGNNLLLDLPNPWSTEVEGLDENKAAFNGTKSKNSPLFNLSSGFRTK